ncbi:MAG: hypothetical protein ABIH34_00440 [Nanoarchaeota archaeon]
MTKVIEQIISACGIPCGENAVWEHKRNVLLWAIRPPEVQKGYGNRLFCEYMHELGDMDHDAKVLRIMEEHPELWPSTLPQNPEHNRVFFQSMREYRITHPSADHLDAENEMRKKHPYWFEQQSIV